MSKFDELKKLAEAATPGPWMRLFGERIVYDRMEDGCRGNSIVRADGPAANNLQFIAAANPAAILELLAIQAQMVAALKQALETIDDYLSYEHNGDPWTEDARTMGEMDINDYANDGRQAKAIGVLALAGE